MHLIDYLDIKADYHRIKVTKHFSELSKKPLTS